MGTLSLSAFFLSIIWGITWALTIQFVPPAIYLAQKRTWLTVVVGIGIDMALGFMAIQDATTPAWAWFFQFIVIALSSVGIITRSLLNEWREQKEIINATKDTR